MAGFLDYHKVRLLDFPRWAEPLREELRDLAHSIKGAVEGAREINTEREHADTPKWYTSRAVDVVLGSAEGSSMRLIECLIGIIGEDDKDLLDELRRETKAA